MNKQQFKTWYGANRALARQAFKRSEVWVSRAGEITFRAGFMLTETNGVRRIEGNPVETYFVRLNEIDEARAGLGRCFGKAWAREMLRGARYCRFTQNIAARHVLPSGYVATP